MDNLGDFKKEIHILLDAGKYIVARKKIDERLLSFSRNDEDYPLFLAEAAGFLIDIGAEALDKESVEEGVKILKLNEQLFLSFLSEQSFNYCLANGMDALYKIEVKDKGYPSLSMIKPNLAEAKNYYYKAFKEMDFKEIDHLELQVLTNLGNNLSKAGRMVDAIRLYKTVLNIQPNFPQALIGLAIELDHWARVSFCSRFISLYVTVYSLLKKGLASGAIPIIYKENIEIKFKRYEELLRGMEFNFSSIEDEHLQNEQEYEKHNEFRKFCIDNFLSLNEHSIYCKCSQASIDDLSIVHGSISLYGNKVGKMELLLNRLKSEFSLARKLYYEGAILDNSDEGVNYSELMDGEIIGEQVEKIRTSFRLCFGIFDKIAHGVCYFFELPKAKNENIYFNSFWESNKCPERWLKVKDLLNPHLVALFSIANDFNYNQGEFSFYKHWRNKLEHNNLILVDRVDDPDLFKLFEDDSFVSKAAFSFFKEQALHLLQICCSAIYSYVYVIRTESLNNSNNLPTTQFIVQPKN